LIVTEIHSKITTGNVTGNYVRLNVECSKIYVVDFCSTIANGIT